MSDKELKICGGRFGWDFGKEHLRPTLMQPCRAYVSVMYIHLFQGFLTKPVSPSILQLLMVIYSFPSSSSSLWRASAQSMLNSLRRSISRTFPIEYLASIMLQAPFCWDEIEKSSSASILCRKYHLKRLQKGCKTRVHISSCQETARKSVASEGRILLTWREREIHSLAGWINGRRGKEIK